MLLLDSFATTRAPWIAGTAILLTAGLLLVTPTGIAVLLSSVAAGVVLIGRTGRGSRRPGGMDST